MNKILLAAFFLATESLNAAWCHRLLDEVDEELNTCSYSFFADTKSGKAIDDTPCLPKACIDPQSKVSKLFPLTSGHCATYCALTHMWATCKVSCICTQKDNMPLTRNCIRCSCCPCALTGTVINFAVLLAGSVLIGAGETCCLPAKFYEPDKEVLIIAQPLLRKKPKTYETI